MYYVLCIMYYSSLKIYYNNYYVYKSVSVLSVNKFSGLWCKLFGEILMLSCINKGHCYYMVTDY